MNFFKRNLFEEVFSSSRWSDDVGTRFQYAVDGVVKNSKDAADKMIDPVSDNAHELGEELDTERAKLDREISDVDYQLDRLLDAIRSLHPGD